MARNRGKLKQGSRQEAGTPNWANQSIWTGDNLAIMRGMNSACVDLIYLDPPFNSKANYAAPVGSKAAGAAFKDTWTLTDVDVEWINLIEAKHPALYRVLLAAMTPSDKAYLVYMAARLLEMHRVLKPDGSIYLHCDPTMSHYLKALMDAIFGRPAFRNEIVWKRFNFHADANRFGAITDRILFYTGGTFFNTVRQPYSDEYIKSKFTHREKDGRRYRLDNLNPPGGRGPVYEFHDVTKPWRMKKEKIERLDAEGRIYTESPIPQLKRYLDEMPGQAVADLWADIPPINPRAKERTGYPTQKPLALLDRMIRASSNEGDVVLDPFCGCATACIAAERLQRQWAGIDISPKAAELVQSRMRDELGLFYAGAHRTDIPMREDLGPIPRYNSPENRKRLYGEQGGDCAGCGSHFEARHLEVDHIIARQKGGTDHIGNLQLLCGNCNRIKGNRGMEYLRAKLQLPRAA